MTTSLIIFIVWLAIAIIGVANGVSKRSKGQRSTPASAPGRVSLEELIEKLQQGESQSPSPVASVQQPRPKANETSGKTGKAEAFKEGERSTQNPKNEKVAGEAKAKGPDMDFDPIEMVVYSEIMQPGYEKY